MKPTELPLGLRQLIRRRKILLMGGTNTGKSWNVLKLVMSFPDKQFFMIDPDGGVSELILDVFGPDKFPNLEYRLTPDWESISRAYAEAKKILKAGDWLLVEHIGRWWDKTQDFYSLLKYKADIATKVRNDVALGKKATVEAEEKESKGALIGGLNPNDWVETRRQHNSVSDSLLTTDIFNVLATTTNKEIQEFRKERMRPEQLHQIEIFEEIGYRPAGETHVPALFSDILLLYRVKRVVKGKAVWIYMTRYLKHRGAPVLSDPTDVPDEGIVSALLKGEL